MNLVAFPDDALAEAIDSSSSTGFLSTIPTARFKIYESTSPAAWQAIFRRVPDASDLRRDQPQLDLPPVTLRIRDPDDTYVNELTFRIHTRTTSTEAVLLLMARISPQPSR